jgi:hypothetical protein
MTKRILIIISIVVIIVAGRYIYKAIYPPIVAVDPQVQTIKQEVIKDRIIIKEVIKDAKQEAVQRVAVMSDDAVADELNLRLEQYRKRRSAPTE